MHRVKYRMTDPRLRPRRTKMQIPGWSGEAEPRADGSREHPWHCTPFSEAAQYGIEIFYPYDNELRVGVKEGRLHFEGDFGPPPDGDRQWPPFRPFGGDAYYTYQLLLDLKVEPGLALKIEPHPRFFTDPTDTTPLAVPALLRNWWPMMFFMVFKAPPEGRFHIFRPGEPMAQIVAIPEESEFELVPMSEEEAAERELQSRRIYESRATLGADSTWLSASNTVFDATYRRLYGAARKLPSRCPMHEAPSASEARPSDAPDDISGSEGSQ
ncbi:hypothetical protein [Methylocystis heyeri]|uniref:hypothetical protein n=1 Tax=Methylocystis heyeri TaxID=391905 RepID=UPI00113521C5|nr:hypothetical protein [Methylocystis heyeri]